MHGTVSVESNGNADDAERDDNAAQRPAAQDMIYASHVTKASL
jgi:hypothetical protein